MSYSTVIDLTLVYSAIYDRVREWNTIPDLGSDHVGILFTILNPNFSISTISNGQMRYNTKKADWKLFSELLKDNFSNFNYLTTSYYSNLEMDTIAELFTQGIVKAINNSIPKVTINSYAKPWWSDDLRELRKVMLKYSRKFKRSTYTLFREEFYSAKNTYFNAIKLAKQEH